MPGLAGQFCQMESALRYTMLELVCDNFLLLLKGLFVLISSFACNQKLLRKFSSLLKSAEMEKLEKKAARRNFFLVR